MKTTLVLSVAMASVCGSFAVFAGDNTPHWTYSGAEGPEQWGKLAAEFAPCAAGKNQSPVNLTAMIDGNLPEISFAYQAGGNEIINNGHTVQVNYRAGSSITLGGQLFELKQFHFHAPSENTIEGNAFALEAHFVHADKDGNLAVIGVMFNEGEANPELEKAWAQMPEKANEKQTLTSAVDAAALLPSNRDYYRFNGSLTTPPCTEGVRWLVLKTPLTASAAQIEKFTHTMHHPNNRPIQPINARIVVE